MRSSHQRHARARHQRQLNDPTLLGNGTPSANTAFRHQSLCLVHDTSLRPKPGFALEGNFGRLRLSIWRDLIFESRVEAGIPSRVAAPEGPETRPLVSVSASSMLALSWVKSSSGKRQLGWRW